MIPEKCHYMALMTDEVNCLRPFLFSIDPQENDYIPVSST